MTRPDPPPAPDATRAAPPPLDGLEPVAIVPRAETGVAIAASEGKAIDALRSNAKLVYWLQGLAVLCGVTAIPGLLIAYGNRGPARDTWLDSHYEWQIDTFWGMFWFWLVAFGVGWVGDMAFGSGLLGHGPALLVIFAGLAWYVSRVVKGWSRLSDGDPVTDY